MTAQTHGGFDLVYSWGVLHHTGDMYRALAAAANLVRPEGMFMVALYRKTLFCGMWRAIKRWYASATPAAQQRAMRAYTGLRRLTFVLRGRSLDEYIRDYGKSRGMDYYNDVHDWMGGYPYESISPQDSRRFFARQGFRLEREFVHAPLRHRLGLFGSGCDEYTFVRAGVN